MLVDIDKIRIEDRIRKDLGDISELAKDIEQNGLINPPTVTPDLVLIAGERRLAACKLLGWQQIEVKVMEVRDYEHQLRLEISENENRKDFTLAERLDWARRLEQVERLKAKERMKNPRKNFSGGEAGITRECGQRFHNSRGITPRMREQTSRKIFLEVSLSLFQNSPLTHQDGPGRAEIHRG